MTVKDIVVAHLTEHGYDGLCTHDCGCALDDLMPCGEFSALDCVPGYDVPTPLGSDCECDFWIVPRKPRRKRK